jgi:hypothetical protein
VGNALASFDLRVGFSDRGFFDRLIRQLEDGFPLRHER